MSLLSLKKYISKDIKHYPHSSVCIEQLVENIVAGDKWLFLNNTGSYKMKADQRLNLICRMAGNIASSGEYNSIDAVMMAIEIVELAERELAELDKTKE